MRNKEKFIFDAKKVLKENTLTDDQVIEDAAHCMIHTQTTEYVILKPFTKTNRDEVFLFDVKNRPATDGDSSVEDYFYLGKGD